MVSTEVCFLSFDATVKMDMDWDKLFGHVYIQVAFFQSDQVKTESFIMSYKRYVLISNVPLNHAFIAEYLDCDLLVL